MTNLLARWHVTGCRNTPKVSSVTPMDKTHGVI